MSVSFEDFLKSAEVLLNNKDSEEIDFRNLISRSYYALFHLAKEKSEYIPMPIISEEKYEKLGSHEKILIKFSQHKNKAIKQLGNMMFDAKEIRCQADYDIHEHIVRSEAAQHFHTVKDLIKKLEQLKENP
jgi:uncharacterized protein (UPF0332 family)